MRGLYLAGLVTVAILASAPGAARAEGGFVLIASTIGPIEAGIVSLLEEQFEAETRIRVRHVGAGTGDALKISEKGEVDLVLVHARALVSTATWIRVVLTLDLDRARDASMRQELALAPGCR